MCQYEELFDIAPSDCPAAVIRVVIADFYHLADKRADEERITVKTGNRVVNDSLYSVIWIIICLIIFYRDQEKNSFCITNQFFVIKWRLISNQLSAAIYSTSETFSGIGLSKSDISRLVLRESQGRARGNNCGYADIPDQLN